MNNLPGNSRRIGAGNLPPVTIEADDATVRSLIRSTDAGLTNDRLVVGLDGRCRSY